jgi:hypothetical protein
MLLKTKILTPSVFNHLCIKRGYVHHHIELYKHHSNNTTIYQYAPFSIYISLCVTSLSQPPCHKSQSHISCKSQSYRKKKPKENIHKKLWWHNETRDSYKEADMMTSRSGRHERGKIINSSAVSAIRHKQWIEIDAFWWWHEDTKMAQRIC